MTKDSLIERIARAIHKASEPMGGNTDEFWNDVRLCRFKQAEAALAAMGDAAIGNDAGRNDTDANSIPHQTQTLNDCPFCGAFAEYEKCPGEGDHQVKCELCNVRLAGFSTKAAAIEAWNTRADLQRREIPVVDEREAFESAYGRHLSMDKIPDAWGEPIYKHSHVDATWKGWQARAAWEPKREAQPAGEISVIEDDKALKAAYDKYERDWSDEEMPITHEEQCAYIAGWGDARDHYATKRESGCLSQNKDKKVCLSENDLLTALNSAQISDAMKKPWTIGDKPTMALIRFADAIITKVNSIEDGSANA